MPQRALKSREEISLPQPYASGGWGGDPSRRADQPRQCAHQLATGSGRHGI